jgi:hypothetical protein
LFSFLACKKKNEKITISGKVVDPMQNTTLSNVSISISGQKIENGTYNSNYSHIASTSTDGNGEFSFEVKNENITNYRLSLNLNNYINELIDIAQESLNVKEDNFQTYNLYPKSFLKINLLNQNPHDGDDIIEYEISNGIRTCNQCCDDDKHRYIGDSINKSVVCIIPGFQDVLIKWEVIRNSTPTTHSENIYIQEFDTTEFNIYY